MGKKKKYYKKPEEKKEIPDTPERREQLIKSYEGQIAYCLKRIIKDEKKLVSKKKHKWWTDAEMHADIAKMRNNIEEWQRRIDACRNGEPLTFLGKKLGKDWGNNNE